MNYLEKCLQFGVKVRPCKCCGNPIIWGNSSVRINRKGKVVFEGRTQETSKTIGSNTYKLNVCENCFSLKYDYSKFNVMCESTKWAFDISEEDYQKSRSRYAMTKKHMIEKYGEEEGTKKWDSYCEQQRITNTFEYKNKKFGWDQDQFDEYNKSRAVTLANFIKRYGEEEGTKKWDSYCEQQRITKSWGYLVNKFGEEKAREINRSKAITINNMIKKYGEKIGRVKYYNWLKQFENREPSRWSHTSQLIFNDIRPIFEEKGFECQYATHGCEFSCMTSKGGYYLDFYVPELKICIEYNGGVFHADPRLYADDEHCDPLRPNLSAKEIRIKDKNRIESLKKELGIDTYVIWEMDYNEGLDIKAFARNIIKQHVVK